MDVQCSALAEMLSPSRHSAAVMTAAPEPQHLPSTPHRQHGPPAHRDSTTAHGDGRAGSWAVIGRVCLGTPGLRSLEGPCRRRRRRCARLDFRQVPPLTSPGRMPAGHPRRCASCQAHAVNSSVFCWWLCRSLLARPRPAQQRHSDCRCRVCCPPCSGRRLLAGHEAPAASQSA